MVFVKIEKHICSNWETWYVVIVEIWNHICSHWETWTSESTGICGNCNHICLHCNAMQMHWEMQACESSGTFLSFESSTWPASDSAPTQLGGWVEILQNLFIIRTKQIFWWMPKEDIVCGLSFQHWIERFWKLEYNSDNPAIPQRHFTLELIIQSEDQVYED